MNLSAARVAHASMKNIGAAERERVLFHKSLDRIPPDRRFLSNPVLAMLAVGEKMLDGELEYHRGNYDLGYEHLREAVRRDDGVPSVIETGGHPVTPGHALSGVAEFKTSGTGVRVHLSCRLQVICSPPHWVKRRPQFCRSVGRLPAFG